MLSSLGDAKVICDFLKKYTHTHTILGRGKKRGNFLCEKNKSMGM